MMPSIAIIDLTSYEFDCTICDVPVCVPASAKTLGIARYEDEVVPDNHKGEWGGAPVCERCYWIERGMHNNRPDAFIPFAKIRAISLGGPYER